MKFLRFALYRSFRTGQIVDFLSPVPVYLIQGSFSIILLNDFNRKNTKSIYSIASKISQFKLHFSLSLFYLSLIVIFRSKCIIRNAASLPWLSFTNLNNLNKHTALEKKI